MIDLTDYCYFWGSIIVLPLWIIMFIIKKETRKEMIISSIMFGIAAVLIEKYYAIKDYWNPNYIFNGIYLEDFIYGFLFGGIASVTLEIFEGYHMKKTGKKHYMLALSLAIATCLIFILLVNILKMNSIIAHIIPLILVGTVVILMNKKLFIPSIISGFIIMLITFFVFQFMLRINPDIFKEYWMLHNLSNIFIINILLEEYIFAFALGFGTAGFYELINGYDLVKDKEDKNNINFKKGEKINV